MVYDDPLHFFQLLPFYFYMLERKNPAIVMKLKVDDENGFEYMFMALDPCINDFVSCCRSVIMIDEIHLKEKFMGVMFVDTTMNGNEQI